MPNKGPCQDAAAPSHPALAEGDEEEEGSWHWDCLMLEQLGRRRRNPWACSAGYWLAAALFCQKSQDFFQELQQLADEIPNKEGIV